MRTSYPKEKKKKKRQQMVQKKKKRTVTTTAKNKEKMKRYKMCLKALKFFRGIKRSNHIPADARQA